MGRSELKTAGTVKRALSLKTLPPGGGLGWGREGMGDEERGETSIRMKKK